MLSDLSFLSPGEIFPPRCEVERLQNYKDNLLLFNDSTYTVSKREYKDSRTRIIRVLNDYQDLVGYPVDLNYHKLTSVSIADLLCGEKPVIKINNKEQSEIDKLLNSKGVDFYNKLRQWAIDISRYGDTVTRVYGNQEHQPALAVNQPSNLFKIIDIEDKDNIKYMVLATPIELPESTEDKPKWNLLVQIHEKGRYTKKTFAIEPISKSEIKMLVLDDGRTELDLQLFKIKNQIGKDEVVATGLSDFAVRSMHQLITSDSCYGHDDYSSLDPILAEIWARLGQIAIILDKHTRPDVYAAISAFEQDASGQWRLKTGGGNTYIVNQGDQPPGYLTWDGQLVACFNELNILFEQLYRVSEMGPIYEAAGKNVNIAFDTMKATFTKPLSKVRRITNDITNELKQIISLLFELKGESIPPEDITITWADGLPNDEKQEIEKAAMRISAGLSTPKQENIDRFGLTEDQAQELAEEVEKLNATKQQALFGGFTNPTYEEDEDEIT